MRTELVVERLEECKCLFGGTLGGWKGNEGWTGGDVGGERGNRVVGGEDGEAGDERAIETARS